MTLTGVTAAPRLTTERLALAPMSAQYFDEYAAMLADAEVTRFITGKPLSREEAYAGFLKLSGSWFVNGYGYWMVVERATGDAIGEVGFVDFKRAVAPSIEGEPEAGWVFARRAHGKGYASEAMRAAIAWGEPLFGARRMSCLIDPENEASLNVARKCGFVETARTTYKDEPTVMLHRPAPTG